MIWLVDTDRVTRDANLASLKKLRCVVTTFKRGLDAMLRLQSATPHLIAVARSLSDGCGIGVATQLRRAGYKNNIILLSCEDDYPCRAAIANGVINLRVSTKVEVSVVSTLLPTAPLSPLAQVGAGASLWSKLTSVVGR